ncbi:MAG: hypothetical protein P4L84_07450 [Isosphaeraceae bacterium]|nr:hypothetical protein [Isosphaeraceae bacterium]
MPLKFRCYRCNQLLGASRSKMGTVISCPKCGSALVVPEPDETSDPVGRSLKPTLGVLTAGRGQDTGSILDIRPEDIRVEPGIELLSSSGDDDAEIATEPSDEDSDVVDLEPAAAVTPVPDRTTIPPLLAAPTPPPPPVVPPIDVEGSRGARSYEPYGRLRARDVVLPRSVVLAWSFFVLAALALAFGAGLLAGHYVWRVHEPVNRLNVAPGPR